MDESFLSDEKVIAASREFVCIRLATYEDDAEAEFLKTVYVSRDGDLENTVFALISPDTKTNLCRPGRAPNFAFRTPEKLADAMKEIAAKYKPNKEEFAKAQRLPQLKNVRLGLNVSSCDGLPSIVCVADSEEDLNTMRAKLTPLAFADELAGKFVYASTVDATELKSVKGYDGKPGFLLIQPGEYGVDGKLVSALATDVSSDKLETAMIEHAKSTAKTSKNHRDHVNNGSKAGAWWDTEIPVTDQGSLKATERNKRRRNK
ncbi:MAG: hypothetical protein AB8B55_11615 [Mariniblastus sp.]